MIWTKSPRFYRAACGAPFAAVALLICLAGNPSALATPLDFTLVNPSSSPSGLQSRLVMTTGPGTLFGAPLNGSAQLAPSGLNGQGSLSTTYNDTATTDSKLTANVTQQKITFGGGTAVANNAVGLLGNLAIRPSLGGASGTAPADYGVKFSSAQDVIIPPIDVTALNIPGITVLNLGTLKSIDVNIAWRDVVLSVNSAALPLSGPITYPQTFDSALLNIGMTGTADTLISAFLQQANFTDFLATGAALIALQQALAGQGVAITSTASLSPLGYNVGFGSTAPLTASMVNDDATLGKIEHISSKLRLTVPVKFDVSAASFPAPLDTLITGTLGLQGNLIGETPFVFVDVPEPSTLVMSAVALAGLGVAARRRRRSLAR